MRTSGSDFEDGSLQLGVQGCRERFADVSVGRILEQIYLFERVGLEIEEHALAEGGVFDVLDVLVTTAAKHRPSGPPRTADHVALEITGLGVLRNTIVADKPLEYRH